VQLIHFELLNICISATEYHLGLLKAKLAKYRSQLLEPPKKSEKGEGFDVLKSGDARVALIGFPSVGKVRYIRYVALYVIWQYNISFCQLPSYHFQIINKHDKRVEICLLKHKQ
jgi:hypothetical protein